MKPLKIAFALIGVVVPVAFLATLKQETVKAKEGERFYVKCESGVLLTCVVYDKETARSYVYAGSYKEGAGLVEIK